MAPFRIRSTYFADATAAPGISGLTWSIAPTSAERGSPIASGILCFSQSSPRSFLWKKKNGPCNEDTACAPLASAAVTAPSKSYYGKSPSQNYAQEALGNFEPPHRIASKCYRLNPRRLAAKRIQLLKE